MHFCNEPNNRDKFLCYWVYYCYFVFFHIQSNKVKTIQSTGVFMNKEFMFIFLEQYHAQLLLSFSLLVMLAYIAVARAKMLPVEEIFNASKTPISKDKIAKIEKTYGTYLCVTFFFSLFLFTASAVTSLSAMNYHTFASFTPENPVNILYNTDAKKIFFCIVFFINPIGFLLTLSWSILMLNKYDKKLSFVKYSSIGEKRLKAISLTPKAYDFYSSIVSSGREPTFAEMDIIRNLTLETEANISLDKINKMKLGEYVTDGSKE